ncbi:SRPBCC family protein [Streptomyces syringium]|uniref:SRPBCC family protein n=1 Tax=Streptomyces syringium TaxID=76729 RepID=UPI003453ABDE
MPRSRHTFRFRSTWTLPAPPEAVYVALEATESYPAWWPQVRDVRLLGEAEGTARFRSFLPYDLTVAARARRRDPAARVLEIALTGDLEGWARWTVLPHGTTGSRARFEQEVEVRNPLMRRWALPARPLFIANHAWMMRAGRRGLRAHLERRADEI